MRLPRKKRHKRRQLVSSEQFKTSAISNWGLLRAGAHESGGLEIPTIPTDVSTGAGKVRLAIGPNQEPRVLLPLTDRESTTTISSGRALSVAVSSFHQKGQILRFLDLICLAKDLETVFGDVVDEMLARIVLGNGCVDAAQSTIEEFRSLLLRTDPAEIDKSRIAGLIAELLFLNRLLDRSAFSWRAWRGPTGDRHDFRVESTSLEVKASLRPDASTITIHGLEQLELPTGGTLHLLRFVLEPVSGGILSVSGLAQNAISKADAPERLMELLRAVGCDDVEAEAWNRYRFRIESETLYEIRDGFPRLTTSMLTDGISPHGVHGITYRIALSVAARYMCDPAMFAILEEKLSN